MATQKQSDRYRSGDASAAQPAADGRGKQFQRTTDRRGLGEPALSPAERVYGWNSVAVLALDLGNPQTPANAISGSARATCQLRFVVGTDTDDMLPALRRHLDALGFTDIDVSAASGATMMAATRVDPENPWVTWALKSIAGTTGKEPALLPNLGGALPNDCFADVLGMPTLWVPHSYRGCNQHALNYLILLPVIDEGLQIMVGLFWDLEDADLTPAFNS